MTSLSFWFCEGLGAVALVVAVTGVVLNNHRMFECFYFWMVSNALSAGLHVHAGLWTLAARDVIFLVLSVHGLYCWRKTSHREFLATESTEDTEK